MVAPGFSWLVRIGLVAVLGLCVVLYLPEPQKARQRFREAAVKVTGIVSNGGMYTITADGPLTRAQTFQTRGWFHVVIANGQTDLSRSAPGGVRIERIGESLEILIPIRQGASVTANARGNRLDLTVEGGSGVAGLVEKFAPQDTAQLQPSGTQKAQATRDSSVVRETHEATMSGPWSEQTTNRPASDSKSVENVAAPAASAETPNSTSSVNVPPPVVASQGQVHSTTTTVLFVLGVAVVAGLFFFFSRRRKAESFDEWKRETETGGVAKITCKAVEAVGALPAFDQFKGDRRKANVPVEFERRKKGRGAEDEATRQQQKIAAETSANNSNGERTTETRTATPSVVFGSYRIGQEVTQLARGWPHSIEILSSRASDDRRAVETSLLKVLRASDTDAEARCRVRTALEDYGFVARQNATLLLASNAYERTAAAHTLGAMRSEQALPFLSEALYDTDAVVRTEAIKALGALGLPSSIGALLDVARRHPEIPASILGPALTACSVESLDAGGDAKDKGVTLARAATAEQFVSEMRAIEPAREVKQLPEWLEDETLLGALDRLESADVEARIVSTQALAQFHVRRAVEALAAMAMRDEAASVRAAAVIALGSIDHESVFAPVLIALADDSREVRAAAARTLSRLSFERADAYMHVMETADSETLREAARACVKAGLAEQAVNRLASEDRRQAFEAFSALSFVVKGGEAQTLLDAVENHREMGVRLAAVHLLGLLDDPELGVRLEMIAAGGGLPAPLQAAVREVTARTARTRQEVFEH